MTSSNGVLRIWCIAIEMLFLRISKVRSGHGKSGVEEVRMGHAEFDNRHEVATGCFEALDGVKVVVEVV